MHMKSCPPLLRSELRLDLSNHREALQRRGHSARVPLAALCGNTVRCCGPPAGGALLSRAKENVWPEEENVDVWSVIRPGHVREKIALFGHDAHDRKVKISYHVTPKRRRRNSQMSVALNLLPTVSAPAAVAPPLSPLTPPPAVASPADSECDARLSVVEMVAFLEQRHAVTCSPHGKLRSSASITLSRAPPHLLLGSAPPSQQQGEEPGLSVSDMIAKLESQSLRPQAQSERRAVGRVLLAEHGHAPFADSCKQAEATPPPSPALSLCRLDTKVEATPLSIDSKELEPQATKATPLLPQHSDTIGPEEQEAPPSDLAQFCKPVECSEEVKVTHTCNSEDSTADGVFAKMMKTEEVCVKDEAESVSVKLKSSNPSLPTLEEPLPGLLFLTPPSQPCVQCEQSLSSSLSPASSTVVQSVQRSPDQSERAILRSASDVGVGAERRRRRRATRALSLGAGPGENFLLLRRQVQSLLEPRSAVSPLSLLPHHLLLLVLSLLPTRSLAALKCSCRYLRLVIDTYDPRPLDALWVCDPRYRDDPCKKCKRQRCRGDVSLCRWHHKPFCQAVPYGPGYWMCCYGDRRDAPGCNVGLHDNRWVPAFNSPLCKPRLTTKANNQS